MVAISSQSRVKHFICIHKMLRCIQSLENSYWRRCHLMIVKRDSGFVKTQKGTNGIPQWWVPYFHSHFLTFSWVVLDEELTIRTCLHLEQNSIISMFLPFFKSRLPCDLQIGISRNWHMGGMYTASVTSRTTNLILFLAFFFRARTMWPTTYYNSLLTQQPERRTSKTLIEINIPKQIWCRMYDLSSLLHWRKSN